MADFTEFDAGFDVSGKLYGLYVNNDGDIDEVPYDDGMKLVYNVDTIKLLGMYKSNVKFNKKPYGVTNITMFIDDEFVDFFCDENYKEEQARYVLAWRYLLTQPSVALKALLEVEQSPVTVVAEALERVYEPTDDIYEGTNVVTLVSLRHPHPASAFVEDVVQDGLPAYRSKLRILGKKKVFIGRGASKRKAKIAAARSYLTDVNKSVAVLDSVKDPSSYGYCDTCKLSNVLLFEHELRCKVVEERTGVQKVKFEDERYFGDRLLYLDAFLTYKRFKLSEFGQSPTSFSTLVTSNSFISVSAVAFGLNEKHTSVHSLGDEFESLYVSSVTARKHFRRRMTLAAEKLIENYG